MKYLTEEELDRLEAALKQVCEALEITTTVERWDEFSDTNDKVQAAITVAKKVLEKGRE